MTNQMAWMDLAPDHPERVAKVLAYFEAGSSLGLGKTEWETIKAVLRKCAAPEPPAGPDNADAERYRWLIQQTNAGYLMDVCDGKDGAREPKEWIDAYIDERRGAPNRTSAHE